MRGCWGKPLKVEDNNISYNDGAVLPRGTRLTEDSYSDVESRPVQLEDNDLSKFKKSSLERLKLHWRIVLGAAVGLLGVTVKVGLAKLIEVSYDLFHFGFSLSNPLEVNNVVIDIVATVVVFSITLKVLFQFITQKVYRAVVWLDGEKIELLNDREGEFVYSGGEEGVAFAGNGVTFTFAWSRIAGIYAGTAFDGDYVLKHEVFKGDDDYKKYEFLRDLDSLSTQTAIREADEKINVIRVRLKKDNSKNSFEEIVIPKRAFHRDSDRSWEAFFLRLLALQAAKKYFRF